MSKSFILQRLEPFGITTVPHYVDMTDANGKVYKATLFSENEYGDIVIRYHRPTGSPYHYDSGTAKQPKAFERRRLKNPMGNVKYLSPKGQGLQPYFAPGIIAKYQSATKVPTLYLIEGEFKAFYADRCGVDAVGLGSIHGFYNEQSRDDGQPVLHRDIVDVIERCKVDRLVFLTDGDTLQLRWKQGKDLKIRANSFFKSAVNFYKSSYHLLRNEVSAGKHALESLHFGHILPSKAGDAKGLDDVLVAFPNDHKKIISELKRYGSSGKDTFFHFMQLDSNHYTQLQSYFGLEGVQNFLDTYSEYIGKRQFVYDRALYVPRDVETKDGSMRTVAHFLHHAGVNDYVRIGTDFMKLVREVDDNGLVQEELVGWNKGTINDDYPPKMFPNFLRKIPKYDKYCNHPDWTSSYKRHHSGKYNLANPLAHRPQPGAFPNTIKFLKHVFQGKGDITIEKIGHPWPEAQAEAGISCQADYTLGTDYSLRETAHLGDVFTVALDWMTIFHQHPKMMLPVPILVSKEKGTGKSTWLKWLQKVYGTNMAILNNEQFKAKFNAHYITKMIIAIDEGFLDVEKKAEKERLKQMVTGGKAMVEFKGVDVQTFNSYAKIILCSNDADSVMKMEDGDKRWFVVKVPVVPEGEMDPDLEDKMVAEIPYFLYWLERRAIQHPRQGRLWFKEEYFLTDQFREIVANTKTRLEKNVDELIIGMFLEYRLTSLQLPRRWIVDTLNKGSKYRTDEIEVKKYLDTTCGYKLQPSARIKIPVGWDEPMGENDSTIRYEDYRQRYYDLKVEDWISEEEIEANNIGKLLKTEKDLPF